MTPLFKWTGGKRRELSTISRFYPSFVSSENDYTYVEPFIGAGAVYWSLNNLNGKNIINDFDYDVSNFYQQVKKQDKSFLSAVHKSSALYENGTHDKQEANYYYWRNLDRANGLAKLSKSDRAARFWITTQLAFSGMRRFNSAGEFNAPYGHYKNLNSSALTSSNHVSLLQSTEVRHGDYKQVVLDNDEDNTFIFLDPPYTRVMKKYSHDNVFDDDKQEELAETLKGLKKAKFMIVIDKSSITQSLYKDYIKHTYELSYGVNIRNRFSTAVEHILATNY